MGKKILLQHGKKRELIRVMHSTYPTVKAALNYECNTKTAEKIRHVAVKEFGGVISNY